MTKLPYTGGPMPLAQLALVRGKNEADMAELRLLEAKGLVDQHLVTSTCRLVKPLNTHEQQAGVF